MENSDNIFKKDFKEIAPELSKIERKNPFEVPADYFEDFSLKIQNKIAGSTKKERNPWYSFILKPQYAMTIFISVVLIASGAYYLNYKQQQLADNGTIYWDEVLNENNSSIIEDFDENTLIEVLAMNSTELESEEIINNDSTLNNISTEELNEYINNNNNDVFYEN